MRKTIYDQMRETERKAEALEDFLGIGIISSINKSKHTAKVILDDDETVSDDFPIMVRSFTCSHCGHTHDWMPEKGDEVVYLIRPGGDGLVIGGIK